MTERSEGMGVGLDPVVEPRSLDQDSNQIQRLGWALWVSDRTYMGYETDMFGFRSGFRLRCRAKAAVMYDRVLCRREFPIVDAETPNTNYPDRARSDDDVPPHA